MIGLNAVLFKFLKDKEGEEKDYKIIDDLQGVIKDIIISRIKEENISVEISCADGALRIKYPLKERDPIIIISESDECGKKEEKLDLPISEEMITEAIIKAVALEEDWDNRTVDDFIERFKSKLGIYPVKMTDGRLNREITEELAEGAIVTWIYEKTNMIVQNWIDVMTKNKMKNEKVEPMIDQSFPDILSQLMIFKYLKRGRVITEALNKSKIATNIEKGLAYGVKREIKAIYAQYGQDFEEPTLKSSGGER